MRAYYVEVFVYHRTNKGFCRTLVKCITNAENEEDATENAIYCAPKYINLDTDEGKSDIIECEVWSISETLKSRAIRGDIPHLLNWDERQLAFIDSLKK